MPKILMNVLKPHVYASKRHKPGGSYYAQGETHARLMVALGHAERAPAPTAAPAPQPSADPAPSPGTYRRRDLVAEEPQAPRKTAAAKRGGKFSLSRRRSDAGDVE